MADPAPPSDSTAGPSLVELTRHADAWRYFSHDQLWSLFDGDRERLNIAHECLGRHPPDRTAVRIAHADGRDEAYTFGELWEGAGRFANFLAAKGVGKGDRVALMVEPSLPFYLALFGAMRAGAVAVPLFTLFGPDGLAARLRDCDPALLLIAPEQAELARPYRELEVVVADAGLPTALAAYPPDHAPSTAASDLALFQYTSGTTREVPEAVKHTHRAVVTVMIAALYGTGARPGDRFFCPASPAWGQGLWHGTVAPLALGITITAWAGPFQARRMYQVLQEHRITNFAAAATHYRMLRNSGLAGEFKFCLEKTSFTGEPVDGETADFAEQTFGTPLCSMYGTTEVGVILANYPGAPDFTVTRGALGKPVPGAEVDVYDPEGRPCPPGVTGEIVVKRRGEWFPTKDRGHTDADGYFFHDGRADDVVISAGWTMSAVEIEQVLLTHPDVREAAVIGVPDPERGQVVKAFVISPRQGDEAFQEELRQHARTRLSRHEFPRQFAFPRELPKTPAGKVNRKVLRDQEAAARDAKGA